MTKESIKPEGEKIRNAVRWVCDMLGTYPEKSRQQLIREAEIRFDLSPSECDFLDRKLVSTSNEVQ